MNVYRQWQINGNMSIEHWANDNDRKNIEVLEKKRLYECHIAITNSTLTCSGWYLVSHGDRPATNILSQQNLLSWL
jgi:hypothetical protein